MPYARIGIPNRSPADVCSSTKGINYQAEVAARSVFPKLREVVVDPAQGTITVQADDCDEVRWIAAPASLEPVEDYKTSNHPWPLGQVVRVGETLNYRTAPGIGTYVRAELLRRDGEHTQRTFLNPFGFAEV